MMHTRMSSHFSPGFTLIELLVVVAVSLLFVGVGIGVYGRLQEHAQLQEVSIQITQMIRSARDQAAAGLNGRGHGVKFEMEEDSWNIILYQGDTYQERDVEFDEILKLDRTLNVETTFVNGEIRFQRGLGLPFEEGSAKVTHEVYGESIITVNEKGMAEQ